MPLCHEVRFLVDPYFPPLCMNSCTSSSLDLFLRVSSAKVLGGLQAKLDRLLSLWNGTRLTLA